MKFELARIQDIADSVLMILFGRQIQSDAMLVDTRGLRDAFKNTVRRHCVAQIVYKSLNHRCRLAMTSVLVVRVVGPRGDRP